MTTEVAITIRARHKKVILRERKRHTARHIASARYAALSPDRGGGGVPHPVFDVGYPIQSWTQGTPHQLGGVPPCLDLGWSTPPHQLDGVPPPSKCQQTPVKTVPSLAGGKYCERYACVSYLYNKQLILCMCILLVQWNCFQ